MKKYFAAALTLLAPAAAHADPISIVVALAPYIGGAAAAFVATAATFVATYGMYIYAAYSVYGTVEARREAKRAAADARAAYNASLQDRTATVLTADPPWRIIYGHCIVGGDIVGIFTSNKTSIRSDGSTYTKTDGFKHIVVAIARHKIHAVHDTLIDGISVGETTNYWASGTSEFANNNLSESFRDHYLGAGEYVEEQTATVYGVGAQTVASSWDSLPQAEVGGFPVVSGVTVTNPSPGVTRITNTNGFTAEVWYRFANNLATSQVRVEYHLGDDDQLANSWLMSQVPSEWTSADRLRGIAYAVITLDLEEPRFQGGPPGITFDVSGRLVQDPRSPGSRVFSENPALIAYDYLTSSFGFALDANDIDESSVIAAANACDVVVSHTIRVLGIPITTNSAMWSASGGFSTAQSKEAVLDDICASMVGYAYAGPKWKVVAGAWSAPVMSLNDSLLAGPIEIVQAGAGIDEAFNGARIKYIPKDRATIAEAEPYSNSVFVAADGQALWADFTLGFIDNPKRAYNAARILVERSRQSMVIRYPAKLHAWPLEVGDRVTITSAEYEWVNKTFRITDWQFGLRTPVMLTLQEDAASVWDLTDETESDPQPNTGLANPWSVPAISNLQATSGNSTLLRTSDGTTIERVFVSWDAVSSPYVTENSKITIRWQRLGRDESTMWRVEEVGSSSSSLYLSGAAGGEVVAIEAYIVNDLGKRGPSKFITHTVASKSSYGPDVSGLGYANIPGGMRVSWTPVPDVDYRSTEVRQGLNWSTAGFLWSGVGSSMTWTPPVDGGYTVWVQHSDTSGNVTDPAVSIDTNYIAVGGGGEAGASSAVVYLYYRSSQNLAPEVPQDSLTYTFATGLLSGGSLGLWSQILPDGAGAYLFVTQSRAYGTGLDDTIAPGEWLSGRLLVKDGDEGPPGTPAFNSATIFIYKRLGTQPATPSAEVTYTFSTASAAGLNGEWSQVVPEGAEQLWMSSVAAVSLEAFDTIAPSEWAPAQMVAAPGAEGSPGSNAAVVFLYKRTETSIPVPDGPSANVTYQFDTSQATGLTNGWQQSLPSSGGPYRWMITASAVSTTNSDTITPAEWAAPQILAEDGASGTKHATGFLYQWLEGTPGNPSGTSNYNWSNSVQSSYSGGNNWLTALPTNPGTPGLRLWVCSKPISALATATSTLIDWSTGYAKYISVVNGSDGDDGGPGQPGSQTAPVYLYQWLATQPGNPNGQSTFTWATGSHSAYTGTNGWKVVPDANPGTSGLKLWVATKQAVGVAGDLTSTVLWASGYTVFAMTANGVTGEVGAPGLQVADPTLFKWAPGGIAPTISGTSTYTWASRNIGAGFSPTDWSTVPGVGSAGLVLWGATVSLLEAATVLQSTIDWTGASVTPRGAYGEDGDDGDPGLPAKTVAISSSSQVIQVSKAGALTPATITISANGQNLSGNPAFTITSGSITGGLVGSAPSTSRTFSASNLTTDSVTVKTIWDTIEDFITIIKVREGSDAISGYLTNPAHPVSTNADGSGGDYSTATGTFKVFKGAEEISPVGNVAFSVLTYSGVSGAAITAAGVYTITGTTADVGTATFRAGYGGVFIDLVFTVSRSKTGAEGGDGPAGYSARRAYTVTTAQSLGSGTVTSTGFTSLPANGSFGSATWLAQPATPDIDEILYQSDGIYNPATTQITWYAPYISALKVGQLSSITVNTGSLTVTGNIVFDGQGNIRGGATSFGAGNGIWQGYESAKYKARWGNAGGARVEWNGDAFYIYNSDNQVVFGSGGTLDWSQINTRPRYYRATARGFSDTQAPFAAIAPVGGIIDAETNTLLVEAAPMYAIYKISRSTGTISWVGAYNPLSGGLTAANSMASALNAIGSTYIVVVMSNDEPSINRLLGNLPAAMYRCGASPGVFGSQSKFMYRGAYVLVGIPGCGSGNGVEAYSGETSASTSAWCDLAFSVIKGNVVVSGSASQPAIDSGNISTYIASLAVGTLQLADQAVTIPVNSFTANGITLPAISTTTTIQSASIVSTGAPIAISAFAAIDGIMTLEEAATGILVQIKRGSTVVVSYYCFPTIPNGVLYGAFSNISISGIRDTPGVGTYTYTIAVTRGGTYALSASNRSLMLLETKK